ncbi:hypothetical protein [Streptomyces sp. 8K308]|uniref:hypothetical protein n=1 Tax=Streptomyces sp. 8K308 TaxID=2530388 RepID=UPI00140505E7|nr:hypothetical protein [Streptomyces sp. 8K308]
MVLLLTWLGAPHSTTASATTSAAAGSGGTAPIEQAFTIDGDAINRNPADLFRGFGAVSCNNTSRLLLDYKEENPEQYWELLNTLFHPVTGMGLTEVKVELGSDTNTSSGTEPASMRAADEEADVLAGAGWHFAADARSINPDIEVSLLRWADPRWVEEAAEGGLAAGLEARYTWYKRTIDAVHDAFGMEIDWIGIGKNENYDRADVLPFLDYLERRLAEDSRPASAPRYDYASRIRFVGADEIKGRGFANDLVRVLDEDEVAAIDRLERPVAIDADDADPEHPVDGNGVYTNVAHDVAYVGDLAGEKVYRVVFPGREYDGWTRSDGVVYPPAEGDSTTYHYMIGDPDEPTTGTDGRPLDPAALLTSVDAVSIHYTSQADRAIRILNTVYAKEFWYSEGIAPTSMSRNRVQLAGDGGITGPQGTLDIANRVIFGYHNAGRNDAAAGPLPSDSGQTRHLFQPAISAFYQNGTYSAKQLIGAHDPWSGWYELDSGVQMVRHFTAFAETGPDRAWHYVDGGASYGTGWSAGDGIGDSGVSRLTLADPRRTDFSTVLTNDAPNPASVTVTVTDMGRAQSRGLTRFETRGPDAGERYDENWFQNLGRVATRPDGDGGSTFTVTLAPYSISTITTLRGVPEYRPGSSEPYERTVLDVGRPGGTLYHDDFEYDEYPETAVAGQRLDYVERRGGSPRYATDMGGAFEVETTGDGPAGGNHLQQNIPYWNKPGLWRYGGNSYPHTLIGDDHWANYSVSMDFAFDLTSYDPALKVDDDPDAYYENYVALGGRNSRGSGGNVHDGITFVVQPDGTWGLMKRGDVRAFPTGAARGTLLGGTLRDFNPAASHTIRLDLRGNEYVGYVDGERVFAYTDRAADTVTGRVVISSGFYQNRFDNLEVASVPGHAPYATERVDNGDERVEFSGPAGSWTHSVTAGHAYLYRTRSDGGAGAVLTVPFRGSGFAIDGDGTSATVDVHVDGELVADDLAVTATGERAAAYSLTSLRPGRHTVTIEVVSGRLVFDAFHQFGTATSP